MMVTLNFIGEKPRQLTRKRLINAPLKFVWPWVIPFKRSKQTASTNKVIPIKTFGQQGHCSSSSDGLESGGLGLRGSADSSYWYQRH